MVSIGAVVNDLRLGVTVLRRKPGYVLLHTKKTGWQEIPPPRFKKPAEAVVE